MINYKEHKLKNGLTVLVNRDDETKMAAINLLYKVGARNEKPHRTGFAHLFEHLMFRGTEQVPNFDIPVQQASGENNAFTNNDYTDYYVTLPKSNIETALWLEADRMTGLDITPEALAIEKKVVLEEYNQRYRNQPYGDMWMLLRDMAYKVHPYRWATIGLTPEHIKEATLDEVKEFYKRYYTPSNAILGIAADIDPDVAFELAEKWFGEIECSNLDLKKELPIEPEQTEGRRLEVTRDVPTSALTIAFKMDGRLDPGYYKCDMISDLLAGGTSARLHQRLVKEKKLFSALNAYISGEIDPGLFIITGYLLPDVTPEEAERGVWAELEELQNTPVSEYELKKVKNKFEANTIFGELNIMNKALNMCYYNMLGDMSLLNGEVSIYRAITKEQIEETAQEVFQPQRSSTLIYIPNRENR